VWTPLSIGLPPVKKKQKREQWLRCLTTKKGFGIVLFVLFLFCFCVFVVLHHGSEEMKQRVAPTVIRGEKLICLAITEPTAGSDGTHKRLIIMSCFVFVFLCVLFSFYFVCFAVAGVETRAERRGNEFIVKQKVVVCSLFLICFAKLGQRPEKVHYRQNIVYMLLL
jgi:hypothetical protein